MVRPKCCRKISALPGNNLFKPETQGSRAFEETVLTLDEIEAVRLADLDNKYQDEAAAEMNVSRQTFGRIIKSARNKIADALINGKTIRIDGGAVELNEVYRCVKCNKKVCGAKADTKCGECAKVKKYFESLDKRKEQ